MADLFEMHRYGDEKDVDETDEKKLLAKLKGKVARKKSPDKGETTKKNKKKRTISDDVEAFTVLGESSTLAKSAKVRRVLPDWLANPDVISVDLGDEQMSVDDMAGLDDDIVAVLKSDGVRHFFPVQRQVIPQLFDSPKNRFFRPPDLCVSAPTGSGKTLAFVLPIVQALSDRIVPKVKALVILPVQDLATQVFKVFQRFCEAKKLRVKLVSGQKTFNQEQSELVARGVDGVIHSLADIVVATPGRVVDHIQKKAGFDFTHFRYLIVDEADRVMEDVQNDWLSHVESAVYSGGRSRPGPTNLASLLKMELPLQKLLFSATLSQNPEKLHQMTLYEPKLFTSAVRPADILAESVGDDDFVGHFTTPAELVELKVNIDDPLRKPAILHGLIKMKAMEKAIVFTNSIDTCHKLAVLLKHMDLKVQELSSKLKFKRAKALSAFRNGKVNVLVATDAMARGIDIGDVDFVISYECPKFVKTYIHRVGRTARGGRPGKAVTFVDKNEAKNFKKMMYVASKNNLIHKLDVSGDHVDDGLFAKAVEMAKDELAAEKPKKLKDKSKKSKWEKVAKKL